MRRRRPAVLLLAAAATVSLSAGTALAQTPTKAKAKPVPLVKIKATAGAQGTFLTDPQGRSLYVFAQDRLNTSTCVSKACTAVWAPYTVKTKPKAGTTIHGNLINTIKRSGGAKQVTYGGHPLYHYVLDKKAGTTKGQAVVEFGASWFLVAPTGAAILPPVLPAPPAGTPVLASISGAGVADAAGVPFAHLTYSANKTADGTSGYFQGTIDALNVNLAGPITCLDVQGDNIGFLYPINYATVPGLQGTAILITLQKGENGAPNKLGFLGPAPAGLFNNTCAPNLATFGYTGTLTVSSGSTAMPVAPIAPPVYTY